MKPFLILVLVLTLMASVLVYKMLADTYEGSFAPTKPTTAENETVHSAPSANPLPDNGRAHSMNTVPTDISSPPSSEARWE